MLGARQTGHDTWQVVPAFSGVTEVSGQIPLSDGDLIVTWARQNCEERDVWVQAPNGTYGEIIIMEFNDTTILRLNEQVVWPINTSVDLAPNVSLTESGIRVAVDAGEYHLNVRQICR